MKSSWKIGRVAGIEVQLHFTLLLLLAWVAWSQYLPERNWRAALGGVGFTLALLVTVVLHELGHALTARSFGIRTRDITLLPIGGVAHLERIPEKPRQELLIALAGPGVNVLLVVLLSVALWAGAELSAVTTLKWVGGPFLVKLLWVNVSLAVFNLVPAFPMDGGRVLRAVLAMRMDYVRATQIAASIGQAFAWVFGILGLFTNPFLILILIALFVWMGAAQEAGQVQLKSVLSGLPVSRVLLTEFHTLAPADLLGRAIESILAGGQHDFVTKVPGSRAISMALLSGSEAGV